MFEFIIGVVATIFVGFLFFYTGAKKQISAAENEVVDIALLAFVAGDNDFDYAKDLFHNHLQKKLKEKQYSDEQLANFNKMVIKKYNGLPQAEYDAYFIKVVDATKRFNERFKAKHYGNAL